MKRPVYHEKVAGCEVSKAYTRKAWKMFTDTDIDLTDLPTLYEQNAHTAEEGKVVAAELVAPAVPTFHNDG